jgi:hypothetical protein
MTDKIVQQVIDKFNQRSEIGIKKYGTTLEQNNNDDFLTHLQEELMDAILYIEKLKSIEISDEEIEKFADEELGNIRTDFDFGVIQGMKWYKEKLKSK